MDKRMFKRDLVSARNRWLLFVFLPVFLFSCSSTYRSSYTGSASRDGSGTTRKTTHTKEENRPSQSTDKRLVKKYVNPAKLDVYGCSFHGSPAVAARSVQQIAQRIQAQKIYYNSRELTDCSGIFHRFLREMQKTCEHQDFPSPKKYRSSRDLALWYHERGSLILVSDPLRMSHLIRPGMVMFYGNRGKKFDKFTERDLKNRKEIHHIGIVVSVEKDRTGRVISYKLFHGRSPGKYAAITEYHLLTPSRRNLPPFGNYDQPWVAIAPLVAGAVISENIH